MAGVAFKLGHSCISCSSCRFAQAGSCIWGPAGPWEVLHMNTHTHTHNTGSFMLPRQTAQCTAMTKQGSCALPHIPLARSMNADRPPPPVQKHCQAFLTGTIPPKTHPTPTSLADRLPTSAAVHSPRPPITLRNHRPCQVWADPAILSATVRVSWCTAAATVGDLITPTWEIYRRWSIKSVVEWLCIWRRVTDY